MASKTKPEDKLFPYKVVSGTFHQRDENGDMQYFSEGDTIKLTKGAANRLVNIVQPVTKQVAFVDEDNPSGTEVVKDAVTGALKEVAIIPGATPSGSSNAAGKVTADNVDPSNANMGNVTQGDANTVSDTTTGAVTDTNATPDAGATGTPATSAAKAGATTPASTVKKS